MERLSKEEIEQLRQSIKPIANRPSELWRKAFNYYNSHPETDRFLSMSCGGCFGSVLEFIIKEEQGRIN